jgi:hypothetical protein
MTEYIVAIPDELAFQLEQEIWQAERAARSPRPGGQFMPEFLVVRVNGFKAEIFADEHPPPHFRISVGSSTANYRIDDFSRMNGTGEVLRYEKIVRKWWHSNQTILIETWNTTRPTDCPVGKIGEPTRRKNSGKGKRK